RTRTRSCNWTKRSRGWSAPIRALVRSCGCGSSPGSMSMRPRRRCDCRDARCCGSGRLRALSCLRRCRRDTTMPDAGHGAARLKALFSELVELAPDNREQFLADACGEDTQLRARLDVLLRAHDGAGDFLNHPVDLVAAAVGDDPVSGDGLEAGDLIGDCELVEHLGRGGFGSVWRARQLQPIER